MPSFFYCFLMLKFVGHYTQIISITISFNKKSRKPPLGRYSAQRLYVFAESIFFSFVWFGSFGFNSIRRSLRQPLQKAINKPVQSEEQRSKSFPHFGQTTSRNLRLGKFTFAIHDQSISFFCRYAIIVDRSSRDLLSRGVKDTRSGIPLSSI